MYVVPKNREEQVCACVCTKTMCIHACTRVCEREREIGETESRERHTQPEKR